MPATSVPSVPASVARRIRDMIATGEALPGQKLPEIELAARFGVSRNSLRESFRLLAQDRLVEHIGHRGVFVRRPGRDEVGDLFRVRLLVESHALLGARPDHPAVDRMRAAVAAAAQAARREDWRAVGTADVEFHEAVVQLTDSPILIDLYEGLSAQLRLMFGLLDSSRSMHEPYIDRNASIVRHVGAGDNAAAAGAMRSYLLDAEAQISEVYAAPPERR